MYRKRNSVEIILKEEYSKNVLEVKRVSDRMISVKPEIQEIIINLISAYAQQVRWEMEELSYTKWKEDGRVG